MARHPSIAASSVRLAQRLLVYSRRAAIGTADRVAAGRTAPAQLGSPSRRAMLPGGLTQRPRVGSGEDKGCPRAGAAPPRRADAPGAGARRGATSVRMTAVSHCPRPRWWARRRHPDQVRHRAGPWSTCWLHGPPRMGFKLGPADGIRCPTRECPCPDRLRRGRRNPEHPDRPHRGPGLLAVVLRRGAGSRHYGDGSFHLQLQRGVAPPMPARAEGRPRHGARARRWREPGRRRRRVGLSSGCAVLGVRRNCLLGAAHSAATSIQLTCCHRDG